jgi:hypothetical protein
MIWQDDVSRRYIGYAMHFRWKRADTRGDDKVRGHSQAGYKKIKICGEKARRDMFEYFWVDTCCIN